MSSGAKIWGLAPMMKFLKNMKSEGVIHVRNIQVRRNGVLKPTHTYVLTFNTPVLPKKVKAAYLSVNVEVYIPNPLRCYIVKFLVITKTIA